MDNAPVKPYNKTEVAQLYNVSGKVLYAWLIPFQKEIGEYRGRCYTSKQIETIFEKLGAPPAQ